MRTVQWDGPEWCLKMPELLWTRHPIGHCDETLGERVAHHAPPEGDFFIAVIEVAVYPPSRTDDSQSLARLSNRDHLRPVGM
jgi:hypothetical protein